MNICLLFVYARPMRFLVTMLLVLLPLAAQAPPKNLKVLTPQELQGGIMRTYVAALGVGQSGGCNYCHVQDRSSDENPKKVTARMMISMVKDINTNIGKATNEAGKTFVTCYTCHRGKTTPETAAPAGLPLP